MRWKTLAVLLALFPLLAFPSTSRALTPAEVTCEEAKLGRLLHRMATNGTGMNLFIWPDGADRYSGLGVYPSFVGLVRQDWQMGFDLQLNRESALLNPRRSLLPQAVLARNDLLTTPFDSPEEEPRIDVSLELAPRVVDPTHPTQGVLINSQYSTPTGSASGASRSLTAENLFEHCSANGPSAFDLQVFEILSRTFRITDQLKQPFPGPGLERYKAVFFRDVEPLTYRVKVFTYLVTCDPRCGYGEASYQFRLRFALDAAGKLAAGRIETLPWCYAGALPPCTDLLTPSVAVIVAPPIFAGHETQPEVVFKSGAFLNVISEADIAEENILTDDIPWPELLRGTAWDRPLGVPLGALERPASAWCSSPPSSSATRSRWPRCSMRLETRHRAGEIRDRTGNEPGQAGRAPRADRLALYWPAKARSSVNTPAASTGLVFSAWRKSGVTAGAAEAERPPQLFWV